MPPAKPIGQPARPPCAWQKAARVSPTATLSCRDSDRIFSASAINASGQGREDGRNHTLCLWRSVERFCRHPIGDGCSIPAHRRGCGLHRAGSGLPGGGNPDQPHLGLDRIDQRNLPLNAQYGYASTGLMFMLTLRHGHPQHARRIQRAGGRWLRCGGRRCAGRLQRPRHPCGGHHRRHHLRCSQAGDTPRCAGAGL